MSDGVGAVADGLAAGQSALAATGHVFGVVRSVNADGTVTVEDGRGTRTSVRCMRSYSPRAVGDPVLVTVTAAGPVVTGAIGPATAIASTELTVSDSAAPGGAGWDEVVSGQAWAKTGALWVKRVTALPPPTGGTVAQAASSLATYRGGEVTQANKAEQGDYSGLGLQTGLASFGSWAGLSGQTATGGVLTIHRREGGHGFTYGEVTAYARTCVASGIPGAPPTLDTTPVLIPAALNETRSAALSAEWCQPFCTGGATAVGFFSTSSRDNIEIDGVTLSVTY